MRSFGRVTVPGRIPRLFWTPVLASLLSAIVLGACRPAAAPLSPQDRLQVLWQSFVRTYIRDSGAVVDPMHGGRVSSEAQSYALVRAVWMRDRRTFERVLAWTDAQLRRDDGLYAWLWDPKSERLVDPNCATDGDVEIAYALAMASVVFDHPPYAEQARTVVRAIRLHASIPVGNTWFPSAGDWAGPERIINLSYFYPYATPWFERLDPGAGWADATSLGYTLVEATLDAGPLALPADFAVLRADGRLAPLPTGHMLSSVFSYDSIRIPWRMDLACRLTDDRRACRLAQSFGQRLAAVHGRDGGFFTRYDPRTGVATNTERSQSFAGALLTALMRGAPDVAKSLRSAHLDDLSLEALAQAPDRYYDANWVWFGLAAADRVIEARTPSVDRLRLP